MSSLKKFTALVLLALLTLILAGTGTGLHVHHGSHGFEDSAHTTGAHDTESDSCAQHCEGETLLEHFLENHGSLFSSSTKIFTAPLSAVISILPISVSPENKASKAPVNREILPDHQYLCSTAQGRAPPFSA